MTVIKRMYLIEASLVPLPANPKAKVLYVTSEKFTNDYIESIREKIDKEI